MFRVLDHARQVAFFRAAGCRFHESGEVRWGVSKLRRPIYTTVARRFFSVFLSWSAHSAGIVIRPVSCGRWLLSASPPLLELPLFLGSNNGFFLPLNIYVHFLPLCVLFVLFCCAAVFFFGPAAELGCSPRSASAWLPLSLHLSLHSFASHRSLPRCCGPGVISEEVALLMPALLFPGDVVSVGVCV